MKKINFGIKEITENYIWLEWAVPGDKNNYSLYWADKNTESMEFQKIYQGKENNFIWKRSTYIPYYFKLCIEREDGTEEWSEVLCTPVVKKFKEQLEKLNRGLIAIRTKQGIFLSWRLMLSEVKGYTDTGMASRDFIVYRDGKKIAVVKDSTNYLDLYSAIKEENLKKNNCADKTEENYNEIESLDIIDPEYQVCIEGGELCKPVQAFSSGKNYYDIPICRPEGGITPAGELYEYHANDMSVGDMDGDGEYEYIVKWDPDNSKDVSQKGYTGHCILDCYKFDGTQLWRIDFGPNIRAGAHYTQFMVYDFNGDGRAEISVKTAPGTKITRYFYNKNGTMPEGKHKNTKSYYNNEMQRTEVTEYITLTNLAVAAGASHNDNYVCDAVSYREHLVKLFLLWDTRPEVKTGQWPKTLEECFGIPVRYSYPLSTEHAEELVDEFIYKYAPKRSEKNKLWEFEGFIYEGPEFLTMFSGDGMELETIDFPFPRVDDGLCWGDYAMERIEPCNRVDRFLSGVAYLDGEHPSLILCRGYYTRACIATYDFLNGKHSERFRVDSGFVPMKNPFCDNPHLGVGTDKVYGTLSGQGNHSLSTADIDGDGYQEIIYGAAVIDHDGSLKYSSYGTLSDGTKAKFGHGDAIHVAKIDPDRPGYEIFHVFEGAKEAPYGYALCDAETGEVLWGEAADRDLGRCMIGDIAPDVRGLQCFVNNVFDCKGRVLNVPVLGTNQPVHFTADLSTQMIDGSDYVNGNHEGIVNDNTHGTVLIPEQVRVNNGTKGNPCLVADILGDFREEILYRRADDQAIRIYFSDEPTTHKLFTLMHDTMYRTGVAWQNNCYNQPGYTKFYFASDMDWEYVLPGYPKCE